MPTAYRVKPGDSLSQIAARFGVASWQALYGCADNADFRRKRPNPNLILAGDVIAIPDGSPAPSPTPSARGGLASRIKAYLAREAKRAIVDVVFNHPARATVFGETHEAGDPFKAFYFAELARRARNQRPTITHFHASERFDGDVPTRQQISRYLAAAPLQMGALMLGLPKPLKTFVPLLTLANTFPGKRYAVLGIDSGSDQSEDMRHTLLAKGFRQSAALCPDIPRGSLASTVSRGNLLLGARHAARRHVAGRSADTTTGLLVKDGWTVHAVRLTAPKDNAGIPEDFDLTPLRGGDTIDVLKILDEVAGGLPFYADITKPDSPFAELKEGDDKDAADIPYNQLFDAVLHLSAPTVPFPIG